MVNTFTTIKRLFCTLLKKLKQFLFRICQFGFNKNSEHWENESMIGTNLQNKWSIIELISNSGGNGQVWKGKNLKGDYAAIKVLRQIEEPEKSKRRKARFENEIIKLKYIKELGIKSIMPILDHGYTDDGRPWYSMPIGVEVSLPDDFESRIGLLVQLSEIIANLHESGIEHRDIKPNNLLTLDGKLTVCDFGLARTEDDDHLTMTGERVGSVGYTAIECVGRSDRPRFECDVYAIGKIAWVFLTGSESPPLGELKSPDDDLFSYWPNIESDTISSCQTLVFAATQRSPQARPSAKQFLDGLSLLISTEPNEESRIMAKPADRARNLFGSFAETNQRITDERTIVNNIFRKASAEWFEAWGETVQALGWGSSRINGGATIIYRNLENNWKQGPRNFSKGLINDIEFEISLTFKYKEPEGQNRIEIGFVVAIEIPSESSAISILEKEYDSYILGPQLTSLEKEILKEVESPKHQFVVIEKLNSIINKQ